MTLMNRVCGVDARILSIILLHIYKPGSASRLAVPQPKAPEYSERFRDPGNQVNPIRTIFGVNKDTRRPPKSAPPK